MKGIEILCRTCCKSISTPGEVCTLDTVLDESKCESLGAVLKSLLPTVNLSTVRQPVLCNSCYVTVANFHKFKRECLKNEATLRNYIRKNGINTEINLSEIFLNADCENAVKVKNEIVEVDIKEEIDPRQFYDSENEVESIEVKVEENHSEVPDESNDIPLLNKTYGIEYTPPSKFPGNKCCYYQCGRSKRVEPNLKQYAFPIKDKERYKLWLINSGNAQFLDVAPSEVGKKLYVCEHHFDKKYLLNKRVAVTAIPEPCFPPVANQKTFECAECCENFSTSDETAKHIKYVHGSVRSIACKLCNKLFVSHDSFKNHVTVHNKVEHVCKSCGKKLDSLKLLQLHKSICGKRFSLKCNICNIKLLSSKAWHIHKKTHVRHYCEICKRSFMSQKHFWSHSNRHQRNEKREPFLCDTCGKFYKTSKLLYYHKKIHKKKVIMCSVCSKQFRSETQLKRHMSKHNTKTPYECKDCNETFRWKTKWIAHMKIHKNPS